MLVKIAWTPELMLNMGLENVPKRLMGLDIYLEEPLCPPVPIHSFEQNFPLSLMFIHFLPQLHCPPTPDQGRWTD